MYCTSCGAKNVEGARSAAGPRPGRRRLVALLVALIALLLAVAAFLAWNLLAPRGVAIDGRSFPDEALRSQVAMAADLDGDGALSPEELAGLRVLRVEGASDFTGLALFDGLADLTVAAPAAPELELPAMPALETLAVEDAPGLTRVALTDAPSVVAVAITGAPDLELLVLPEGNGVEELEVPQGTEVTNLSGGTEVRWANYAAYAAKLAEYLAAYGEPKMVQAERWNFRALEGVCVAELVDFGADGADELLVCYFDEILNPEGRSSIDHYPEAYRIEVWEYVDGEVRVAYSQPPSSTNAACAFFVRFEPYSAADVGGLFNEDYELASPRLELYQWGGAGFEISHYHDTIFEPAPSYVRKYSIDGVSTDMHAGEWAETLAGRRINYNLSDYGDSFGDYATETRTLQDCVELARETLRVLGLGEDAVADEASEAVAARSYTDAEALEIYRPVIEAAAADDGSGYAWGRILKPTHYAIDDVDGDAVPELLFGSGSGAYVVGIWTLDDSGSPVDLFEDFTIGYRSSYHVLIDGRVSYHGSGGAGIGASRVYRIDCSGVPKLMEVVSWEYDFMSGAGESSYTNLDEGIYDRYITREEWAEISRGWEERESLPWHEL